MTRPKQMRFVICYKMDLPQNKSPAQIINPTEGHAKWHLTSLCVLEKELTIEPHSYILPGTQILDANRHSNHFLIPS